MGAADALNNKRNLSYEEQYALLDLSKLHLTPWQQELHFWDASQGHRNLAFSWCTIKAEGLDKFAENSITKTADVFMHTKGFHDLVENLSKFDIADFLSVDNFPYGYWLVELAVRDVNENIITCTLFKGGTNAYPNVTLTHPLVLESILEGKDFKPFGIDEIVMNGYDCSYRRYRNGINMYPGISVESALSSIEYTLNTMGVEKRKDGDKVVFYRNYLDLPVGSILKLNLANLDKEIKETVGYVRSILLSKAVQSVTTEKLVALREHWNSYSNLIEEKYYPYVNKDYTKTFTEDFNAYFTRNKIFERLEAIPNLPLRYFIPLFNPIVIENIL